MSDWGWYECQECGTARKVNDVTMTETEVNVYCEKCRMRRQHWSV